MSRFLCGRPRYPCPTEAIDTSISAVWLRHEALRCRRDPKFIARFTWSAETPSSRANIVWTTRPFAGLEIIYSGFATTTWRYMRSLLRQNVMKCQRSAGPATPASPASPAAASAAAPASVSRSPPRKHWRWRRPSGPVMPHLRRASAPRGG